MRLLAVIIMTSSAAEKNVYLNLTWAWPTWQWPGLYPIKFFWSTQLTTVRECIIIYSFGFFFCINFQFQLNFASMCEIWNSNCCKFLVRCIFGSPCEKSKYFLLFFASNFIRVLLIISIFISSFRTITIHVHTRYHPSLSKARSCCGRREKRPERSHEFPSRFSTRRSFRTTSTSTWSIGRRRTFLPSVSAVACICGVPVRVK